MALQRGTQTGPNPATLNRPSPITSHTSPSANIHGRPRHAHSAHSPTACEASVGFMPERLGPRRRAPE